MVSSVTWSSYKVTWSVVMRALSSGNNFHYNRKSAYQCLYRKYSIEVLYVCRYFQNIFYVTSGQLGNRVADSLCSCNSIRYSICTIILAGGGPISQHLQVAVPFGSAIFKEGAAL